MFPKAKANAARALELDDTIASAHNSLAAVHIFYDWDWAAAEREARRALELSPNESVTHAHFADYLSIRARHSEAVAAYSRVLALDPISHGYIAHFALILYRARRYDESIQQCRKSLEIDPDYVNALWFLALSLEQKGERREAMAALEKAVSLSQAPHHRALLGRAYALAGETAKAIDILDQLTALSERRYVSPIRPCGRRCGTRRPGVRVRAARGGVSAAGLSDRRAHVADVRRPPRRSAVAESGATRRSHPVACGQGHGDRLPCSCPTSRCAAVGAQRRPQSERPRARARRRLYA